MQAGGGPIKVGYAKNVWNRWNGIQADNHEEIRFLMAVELPDKDHAKDLEKLIHKKMRRHHVRGEWFDADSVAYAKMLLLDDSRKPIKSLEYWLPGLYDRESNCSVLDFDKWEKPAPPKTLRMAKQ